MFAVKPFHIIRWSVIITCVCSSSLLTSCMNPQNIKPAVDMFLIYDGRPSTAVEREQAINDCYGYFNATPNAYTTVPVANQICMLQLGFRAPNGELLGLAQSDLQPSAEGCAGDPDDPVCWAIKYGWPQDPPPRWAKPGADPDNLGNVWYSCYASYMEVSPYATFVTKMDQCMAQRYGYTVVHPNSPAVPWLPHQYWPNCKKPEAEMNWLEKKWCPGQRPLSPPPETTQR